MSKIEWTDETWNPVRGCSRVSEGCRNCYAEAQALRFSGKGQPYEGLVSPGPFNGRAQWTGVVREVGGDTLTAPLRWRKPRRVFVNSMSDLFHEKLSDEVIDRVFAVMALAPMHTFQVLTKRPERMREYFNDVPGRDQSIYRKLLDLAIPRNLGRPITPLVPLPNVWLGTSIENQETADERIPHLLETPAAIRFVSYEPALGPVDFRAFLGVHLREGEEIWRGLDWIIVGGESGPGARPFDIQWGRTTIEQCKAARVPVFVKQLGALAFARNRIFLADRKGGDPSEWAKDLRMREWPV